jgi:hypothetical protein
MYLYTTVQMNGHVLVYYVSSERSCICILRFKSAVMYLHSTVQVSRHVFAYYGRPFFLEDGVTIKTVSIGTCGSYKDCVYWNMW